MAMYFHDLDERTRALMLIEFETEQSSGNPFRTRGLSPEGLTVFPGLVGEAIRSGNEETLAHSFCNQTYWNPTERYVRDNVPRDRKVNLRQTSERLGLTEFNTWYVRGLSKRLIEEGASLCEVYRGAEPKYEVAACSAHEGKIFSVQEVYLGHRAHYWPEPGDPEALSIPFGYGCHHTIRRVAGAGTAAHTIGV